MKTWTMVAGMFLVLVLSACASGGPKVAFTATLNGANEKPNAVVTTATGTAAVALNESAKTVSLTGTYSGLTPTAAHIHGPAGKDAVANPPLFTLTAAGGQLSGGPFNVTDQQIADLRAGLWYVNVHSAANPGGEIRGQLE